MKKLILPAVMLVVLYVFTSTMLRIPESLPEGTVVPAEVKEILASENIDKAIIYSNFRNGWYFFNNVFGFVVTAAILLLGISATLRKTAQKWAEKITSFDNAPLICGGAAAFLALLLTFASATPDQPVSAGALGLALAWGVVGLFIGKSRNFALTSFYIILLFLLLEVLNLPFAYYRGFVVEHHFELSNETFGKWFANILKGDVIGYLFAVLLIPLAYWGIKKSPRFWWAWIAGGSVPVVIFMMVISPVYLDPLFNKYEELKDETLRTRLLTMAEESGISGSRVFQVDKSKETKKVNAYVTGLFGSKRIVLWDTILEKFEPQEIEFVMGHEMGHYVLNHVWKFIGLFTVTLFILLFVISRSINLVIRKFGDKMGFQEITDIASLPLLMLMLSLLMFFATPVFNGYSRSIEHDADVFGLSLTQNGDIAATAFVKLANENLSNPSPHPFIEFWLFNHPTLEDRIDFCKQFAPVKEEPPLPSEPVEVEEMTEKQ